MFWKALVSSRLTATSIRWLSSLIGFLKSLITVMRSPSGPKTSFWKLSGWPPLGPTNLLLDHVEHSGLELVGDFVQGGEGVVEVEAHGLVAGDGGGHPRLGPKGDRGQREDLEQPGDGPGGVDEGLGEAVIVAGAQGQAAADRFETIDAQLLDQDFGLLGVGVLGVGLDHDLDELGDVEIPDHLRLGGIGFRLGLRVGLGRAQRVFATVAMGGQVLDDAQIGGDEEHAAGVGPDQRELRGAASCPSSAFSCARGGN